VKEQERYDENGCLKRTISNSKGVTFLAAIISSRSEIRTFSSFSVLCASRVEEIYCMVCMCVCACACVRGISCACVCVCDIPV